jgi:MFS family permease
MTARAAKGLGGRYWKLWSASAVANLGDGIFQVAVALLAVKLTRSPVLVAGVAFAARLPWLFLSLPAGAWADRWDRRVTMLRMNAARVVLLGVLAAAVAADVATIAMVYVVALGLGCAEVLFDTSSQTIMPAVVESKDDLSRANGRLYAAEMVTNQFVGPPLGGALVAVSAALAVAVGGALYAVAVVALLLLPGTYRTVREGPPTSLRADIAEGLRYLVGHRVLRTLGVLLGVQNLLLSAEFSIFVLFAVDRRHGLGLSDVGVGVLLTFGALGGVLGSLVAARVEQALGRTRLLAVSVAVTGAALALPGVVPHVVAAAVSGASIRVASTMWNVVTVSLRQRIIPSHLLGRVNSGYRLLGWGTMPIGAALGGLIGDAFRLRSVFVVAGVGVLVTLVPLLVVITDEAIRAAEAPVEPSAAASSPVESA